MSSQSGLIVISTIYSSTTLFQDYRVVPLCSSQVNNHHFIFVHIKRSVVLSVPVCLSTTPPLCMLRSTMVVSLETVCHCTVVSQQSERQWTEHTPCGAPCSVWWCWRSGLLPRCSRLSLLNSPEGLLC